MAPLSPLVEAHRADLTVVADTASAGLVQAWPDPLSSAVDQLSWLMDSLPSVVDIYGSAAASLGANFYDDSRAAADVSGNFTAITAQLPDVGRTDSLARWSLAGLFTAAPGSDGTVDLNVAQTKLDGGLQRIILNADRQTVIGSAAADPKSGRWKRVGEGKCEFCRMLIDRGGVYRARETADFKSHDHCGCVAVPVWY